MAAKKKGKEENKTAPDPAPVAVFTKEQLAASKRFSRHRDVVMAVLEDGESYTVERAQGLIDKFFERKV